MGQKDIQMIIQFSTKEKMGDEKELEERFRLEELIGEALQKDKNGFCDGGDVGLGKMNIFVFVQDTKKALATILQIIENNKIKAAPIIAIREGDNLKVIYPEDYQGEFSY